MSTLPASLALEQSSSQRTESEWLPRGAFQPKRYRPGGIGNWSGHLPFAADLIRETEPKLLVELGTHYGESYFGFCQAVAESLISCACYSVDTWVGEPHAGFYGEDVYNEVESYNSIHYSAFSYLLRTTFDDAQSRFEDDSIDLLHVDGLHTHEAVSHDVLGWMKKIRPGGILLLHDIMGRHADFGVWRFWEELAQYGERFAFTHGWGLGVFQKPGLNQDRKGMLHALLHSSAEKQQHIRHFYELCAAKLSFEHPEPLAPDNAIFVQVYPFQKVGYSGEAVFQTAVDIGNWRRVSIELPTGLCDGPLRIDPANRPAIVDIALIQLSRLHDKEILWTAEGSAALAGIACAGDLERLDLGADRQAGYQQFVSFGSDPQLILPHLEERVPGEPLLVDVELRIQDDLLVTLHLLKTYTERSAAQSVTEHERDRLRAENAEFDLDLHQQREQAAELQGQLAKQAAEFEGQLTEQVAELRSQLTEQAAEFQVQLTERVAELQGLLTQRVAELQVQLTEARLLLDQERASMSAALQKLQAESYLIKTDLSRADSARTLLQRELAEVQPHLAQVEQTLKGVLASKSWRVTAPLRNLLARMR